MSRSEFSFICGVGFSNKNVQQLLLQQLLLHFRAKAKVRALLIKEMLFDNDVALTLCREKGIQQLINQFAHGY